MITPRERLYVLYSKTIYFSVVFLDGRPFFFIDILKHSVKLTAYILFENASEFSGK